MMDKILTFLLGAIVGVVSVGLAAEVPGLAEEEPQCVVSSIRSDELPARLEPDLTQFERKLLER
jgi:hypothetical protein